jgi:hypothetical protein
VSCDFLLNGLPWRTCVVIDTGPDNLFGETALHWAALLGEDRLGAELIRGSNVNLRDEKYNSPPLGWPIHGWCDPPAGNHSRQREVVALLVAAGASVEPEWLEGERVRADPQMLAPLGRG